MKTCTKCCQVKELDAFSRNRRNKTDGRQPKCKECVKRYWQENAERISERLRKKNASNPEPNRARVKEWVKQNPERAAANKRKWLDRNADQMNEIRRKWMEANTDYIAENCRRYQAAKRKAVPVWADRKEMRKFYAQARRLTLETGLLHHVDHVVPIISEIVCGLHVPSNLQVLLASENVKKGNRVWPDMP